MDFELSIFHCIFNCFEAWSRQGFHKTYWSPLPLQVKVITFFFYGYIGRIMGSGLVCSLTADSMLLRSYRAGRYPNTHFVGGLFYPSKRLISSCTYYFTRNWQMPLLNQWKGKTDRRKYSMINHERMLPDAVSIVWTRNLLVTSRTRIRLSNQGWSASWDHSHYRICEQQK